MPTEIRLPRYFRPKTLKGGVIAYYWSLPTWAKPPNERHGKTCPLVDTALGTDLGKAITKADALNDALDQWREGTGATVQKGTVKWLFAWYRTLDRFTKNIGHQTRKDYRDHMDRVEAMPMKDGSELGTRLASKVTATLADAVYGKLQKRGARQASYAMQVCRRVWNEAVRHGAHTGVTSNPFASMGLSTTATKGNRETTRTEYDAYRKAARELGYQSMATAAALGFELGQRVWDVFGFEDPDGRKARGILWIGYRPGVSITLTQSKGGKLLTIPLISFEPGGDEVILYPELEEELARTPRSHEQIVVEERSGLPYKKRRVSTVHRAICDKAGLPKEMTFTGFRHGGLTEMGDAGIDDVRPVSGHTQLQTTAIYNKATQEKARKIGVARRAHVSKMSE